MGGGAQGRRRRRRAHGRRRQAAGARGRRASTSRTCKSLADEGKKQLGSGVVAIVGITDDGKAGIVVGVTDDLTARFSAVDLVRKGAEALGGKGGGGRPDMAQAGGPDGAKADAALAADRSGARRRMTRGRMPSRSGTSPCRLRRSRLRASSSTAPIDDLAGASVGRTAALIAAHRRQSSIAVVLEIGARARGAISARCSTPSRSLSLVVFTVEYLLRLWVGGRARAATAHLRPRGRG